MPTLSEIEADIAALNAQKVDLELQAATALVPIYEALSNRLNAIDVDELLQDVADLQGELSAGSIPYQQAGYVITVLTAVKQFFTDEGARLAALTAAPIAPPLMIPSMPQG